MDKKIYKRPIIVTYYDTTEAVLASSLNSMDGDADFGGGTTGEPRVKESEEIWDFNWNE